MHDSVIHQLLNYPVPLASDGPDIPYCSGESSGNFSVVNAYNDFVRPIHTHSIIRQIVQQYKQGTGLLKPVMSVTKRLINVVYVATSYQY